MFFYSSKIFWFLVQPLNLALFLPYDENCLMMGEIAYADFAGAKIEKLTAEEVVTREDYARFV